MLISKQALDFGLVTIRDTTVHGETLRNEMVVLILDISKPYFKIDHIERSCTVYGH